MATVEALVDKNETPFRLNSMPAAIADPTSTCGVISIVTYPNAFFKNLLPNLVQNLKDSKSEMVGYSENSANPF